MERSFSVVLVRPNKVRLKVYDAQVVADGKQFRATVNYLPGQVLTKDDPAKLTLPLFDSDPILAQTLTNGPAGIPIPLRLLLDDDPLKWLLQGAEEPQRVEPGEIDGRDCYRIKIQRPDGAMVLWIDQETFVLRRLLPPLDSLRQTLETRGPVESLSLVVELTGAAIDGKVDPKLFTFELPKDAEAVKYFLPPSARLLGKRAPRLKFVDLAGKPVTTDSLAKKIVVLDFWATWSPSSLEGLRLLERIREKFKNNDRVVFLAVSLDDVPTDDKKLQQALDDLKIHVRIVRDPEQTADALCFKDYPLLPVMPVFVLGPDGVVQYYDVQYFDDRGGVPSFTVDLPGQLEQLLAGKDVYPLGLKRYDDLQKAHQQAIEAAAKGEPPVEPGVKEIPIPPGQNRPPQRTETPQARLAVEMSGREAAGQYPGGSAVRRGAAAGSRRLLEFGRGSRAQRPPAGHPQARHPAEGGKGLVSAHGGRRQRQAAVRRLRPDAAAGAPVRRELEPVGQLSGRRPGKSP